MADKEDQVRVEAKHRHSLSTTASSVDASNATKMSETEEGQTKIAFLRSAISKTVEKCISSVRLSSFVSSYPEVCKKNGKVFQAVHQEYKERLNSAINSEIDVMINEENLEQLLSDLGSTCSSTKQTDKQAWRPSGCPDKDLAAHLMPLRQKQKQKMETLLEGIQRDNRRLESLVKQRRKHLTVTQQQVILSQTRVKQSVESLPTREIYHHLTGTTEVTETCDQEEDGNVCT